MNGLNATEHIFHDQNHPAAIIDAQTTPTRPLTTSTARATMLTMRAGVSELHYGWQPLKKQADLDLNPLVWVRESLELNQLRRI
jgi:hypothetical protein